MIMNQMSFFELLWIIIKLKPITAIVTVLWAIFLIIWFFARLKYQKDNHFI